MFQQHRLVRLIDKLNQQVRRDRQLMTKDWRSELEELTRRLQQLKQKSTPPSVAVAVATFGVEDEEQLNLRLSPQFIP
jgi:uncharacterized coiled-coil protein SlyX